ncbi:LacI family DNA-binding transcriptional regulator [Petroclostridium sp. X23]|uniref:LacI family DNA-binding transcriptional regulator n=1 Tax=Petroclostridium sp. X23 TaxID=3045146 RepID=UPI0032C13065
MGKNNITITDIAKEAGVSKATVSRVLNNSAAVDEKTRKHVLDVMKKNRYSPSATARSLSKQVSSTIGVIVPEVDNNFFGEMIRGVIDITDKNDLTLICCNTDDSADKDLKALDMLKSHRIRGLIYDPAIDYSTDKEKKKVTQKLKELGAPVVVVDRNIGLNHDGIFFNDYKAVYESVTALIENGHRKIAIINGTQERVLARERQQGFMDAMKDAGVTLCEDYIFFGDYSMDSAYNLTKELLKLNEQPTAVVTCNNQTSKGFLKAIYEVGKKVPKDYTNIALDKVGMLNILGIPYDYIERNAYQLGKKAMELLIQRIAFPEMPLQKIILEAPFMRQTF